MIGQSADVRHHVSSGVAFAKVATSFRFRQHSVMVDAIPAATVIIVRDLPRGHEVLMIERHTQLAFAGGAAVFPGGRIDDDDRRIAALPDICAIPSNVETDDAAGRIAAIRESLEETGLAVGNVGRTSGRERGCQYVLLAV